jgi:hypothetical protein
MLPQLTDTFDLTYRPTVGELSYYSLDILYRSIGDAGSVAGVENYRGVFRRSVDDVVPGRVSETITWRHIGRREGSGDSGLSPWDVIDWAEGFSYPFDAEAAYDDFHWGYDSFPRDDASWLVSWNVLLLTVDAHFEFDFLRSRRHGAIEQLRHVGDSVLTPDSDHPFWLGLPPVVDVPGFTKRNLRTTFVGLTVRDGTPCALLDFGMDVSPFQMTIAGTTLDVSSIFRGTLHVRLDDGSLQYGEFDEVVMRKDAPVYPCYELRRVDEHAWENGTLLPTFDSRERSAK